MGCGVPAKTEVPELERLKDIPVLELTEDVTTLAQEAGCAGAASVLRARSADARIAPSWRTTRQRSDSKWSHPYLSMIQQPLKVFSG